MSKLRGSENIVDDDDGDSSSWQELNKAIKASTDNEEEQLSKLTVIVLEGVVNRLTEEMMMIFKKKDTKHQQNIVKKKRTKSRARTVTQLSSDEGGEGESLLMTKPKRQKTSGNDEKKKPNQKKRFDAITELAAWGLEPPPDMPEAFKNRIENMGGTDVKLVIQKKIYATDLSKSHNRLSMPINQIRNMFFLSEAEEEKFKKEGGMDVRHFVEPCLKVSSPMHLTKWIIGGSPAYVFNTQWYTVAMGNADSLKPKAVVQIWSFRVGPESELGFAMIKVRDGEDGHHIN